MAVVGQGESFVATRDLRVAVGEDREVVDVKRGEPWPSDARARLDVLIRVGHVVRFDENGEPDRRSRRFVKRLGMKPPVRYRARSFEQRAAAESLKVDIAGRRVRVLAGRPDGDVGDLFVVDGRAFVLRRGTPDGPTAAGARSATRGASSGGTGRRPASDKGKGKGKRRRRRPSKA